MGAHFESLHDFTGRCLLPQDPGDCKSFVQKWYYNKKTRSCQIFEYGGCGGNDNKFNSENECLQACTVGKGELASGAGMANQTKPNRKNRTEPEFLSQKKRTEPDLLEYFN